MSVVPTVLFRLEEEKRLVFYQSWSLSRAGELDPVHHTTTLRVQQPFTLIFTPLVIKNLIPSVFGFLDWSTWIRGP